MTFMMMSWLISTIVIFSLLKGTDGAAWGLLSTSILNKEKLHLVVVVKIVIIIDRTEQYIFVCSHVGEILPRAANVDGSTQLNRFFKLIEMSRSERRTLINSASQLMSMSCMYYHITLLWSSLDPMSVFSCTMALLQVGVVYVMNTLLLAIRWCLSKLPPQFPLVASFSILCSIFLNSCNLNFHPIFGPRVTNILSHANLD